jgi:tRNA1Val (adenine37-N6)-methyltransferase
VSPLKVGTDSMLLGSFISSDLKLQGLDLGAGTGVLSLMLAQKNQKLQIDAVEIDANVANECDLNFQNSKWKKKLKCITADYLQFPFKKKYDLIFSNPPYHFENILSPDNGVNISKHSLLSDYIQFLQLVKQLLTENGDFWIILPFSSSDQLTKLASEHRLFLKEYICIHSKPSKKNIRVILNFSSQKQLDICRREFVIRNENNLYSEEYIALTKDFHSKDLC